MEGVRSLEGEDGVPGVDPVIPSTISPGLFQVFVRFHLFYLLFKLKNTSKLNFIGTNLKQINVYLLKIEE